MEFEIVVFATSDKMGCEKLAVHFYRDQDPGFQQPTSGPMQS